MATFAAAFAVAFGSMYGLRRWNQAEISAEDAGAGQRRLTPESSGGCTYFQRSMQESFLRTLAFRASALPKERCMHGPVSLIFGQDTFRDVPLDRWGREFFVDCHPGPQLVRVFSFGPDGQKNTADDVGQAYPWIPRSEADFRAFLREPVPDLESPPTGASTAP